MKKSILVIAFFGVLASPAALAATDSGLGPETSVKKIKAKAAEMVACPFAAKGEGKALGAGGSWGNLTKSASSSNSAKSE